MHVSLACNEPRLKTGSAARTLLSPSLRRENYFCCAGSNRSHAFSEVSHGLCYSSASVAEKGLRQQRRCWKTQKGKWSKTAGMSRSYQDLGNNNKSRFRLVHWTSRECWTGINETPVEETGQMVAITMVILLFWLHVNHLPIRVFFLVERVSPEWKKVLSESY